MIVSILRCWTQSSALDLLLSPQRLLKLFQTIQGTMMQLISRMTVHKKKEQEEVNLNNMNQNREIVQKNKMKGSQEGVMKNNQEVTNNHQQRNKKEKARRQQLKKSQNQ